MTKQHTLSQHHPDWAARIAVVDLSKALLKQGLVVRTWGNVSNRTKGDDFVITPSGRAYDSMIEGDLATVTHVQSQQPGKICASVKRSLHTSGAFKASSEYPMHALCYQRRPEAMSVAHTHQCYASALSLCTEPISLNDADSALLGQSCLPVSSYGLPGTHKLHAGVDELLTQYPAAKVLLLAAHGVFLCGSSAERTLALARNTEEIAKRIYMDFTGATMQHPQPTPEMVSYSVRRRARIHYFALDGREIATPLPNERAAHERCYSARPKVNAIKVCFDSEVERYKGIELHPYLDDFAQIVGPKATDSTKANAVLSREHVLCLGTDLSDATAVETVLKKNARAARVAEKSGAQPIANWECVLMNKVYQLKYSKQAG